MSKSAIGISNLLIELVVNSKYCGTECKELCDYQQDIGGDVVVRAYKH